MDVNSLIGTVFSGLSVLVVEDVADGGDAVVVTARTRDVAVPCPVCGTPTAKVHGYHRRTMTDVPVDGRQVVVHLRVRQLVCPVLGCRRQTFREQIPGLLERHQRRTVRLAWQISQVARELCGRAAARLTGLLAVPVSRSTALRHLRRLPLPQQANPRVIGVDDFALRRRHRYATIITDAETGRRVAVLPDREAATLESWLRDHPGIEVVCRDGSATYAEAVRRALPDAVQVSDRWHLWRNLCDKVLLEVRAHAGCWATINPPRPGGVREQTTRERWNKVHSLLGQGVGLLDCSRRLNLALNTVKRYARMPEPQALRIAPAYRPTLVDPYRDHLRERRQADPAVPVLHLDTAEEAFGPLDILVNNARLTRDATLRTMSEEDFDTVIGVHLRGTWNGTRAAAAGTRFLCTAEAPVHQRIKEQIVRSSERDTALILRPLRNTSRVAANAISEEVVRTLEAGGEFPDVRHLVAGQRGRKVFEDGDLEAGIWTVGMAQGLIDDIPTVAELIGRIVTDAEHLINKQLPTFVS